MELYPHQRDALDEVFIDLPDEVFIDEWESWKEIADFPGYFISNFGRIFSDRSGRLMSPSLVGNGYYGTSLRKGDESIPVRIHQLVAKTFLGDRSPVMEVNHENGVKTDNYPENLNWVTHRENMIHASSTGLLARKFRYVEIVDTGQTFSTLSECADFLNSTVGAVWAAIDRKTAHKGVVIQYVD